MCIVTDCATECWLSGPVSRHDVKNLTQQAFICDAVASGLAMYGMCSGFGCAQISVKLCPDTCTLHLLFRKSDALVHETSFVASLAD